MGIEDSCRRVHCVGGSGLVRKRIRLNRKPPAHLVGFGIQCRPRLWKRLYPVEISLSIVPDPKRRCIDQDHADLVPAQIRTGLDGFLGSLQAHAFISACPLLAASSSAL